MDYDLWVRSPCSSSRHEALFLPVYDRLVCDPEVSDRNWEVEPDVRNLNKRHSTTNNSIIYKDKDRKRLPKRVESTPKDYNNFSLLAHV